MLKKLLIGTVLLSTSLLSQAGIISVIDGADMAGMEVTAFFGDGSSETQIWSAKSADTGAATGNNWSLSLSGETFGDYDPVTQTFYGAWQLINGNATTGIVGLEINAGIADIYFDNLDTIIYTAGSDVGRPLVSSDDVNTTSAFSDPYSSEPDLFGILNITWSGGESLAVGEQFTFLTDTDQATVSEPATALVFLSGLLALVNIRRKS